MPSITLTWADNNPSETAHRIYRSTAPMNPASLPAPLVELGADVTSYVDSSVVAGTTYFYRVAAVRGATVSVSAEMIAVAAPGPAHLGVVQQLAVSTTSLSVNMPSTVDAGDLLLVNIAAGSVRTFTPPAGWTALGGSFGTSLCSAWFYRVADGTEGGTAISIGVSTAAYCSCQVHRFKAGTFHATDPLARQSAMAGGPSNSPLAPAITSPWAATNLVRIASTVFQAVVTVAAYPLPDGRLGMSGGSSGGSVPRQGCCNEKTALTSIAEAQYTLNGSVVWLAESVLVRGA